MCLPSGYQIVPSGFMKDILPRFVPNSSVFLHIFWPHDLIRKDLHWQCVSPVISFSILSDVMVSTGMIFSEHISTSQQNGFLLMRFYLRLYFSTSTSTRGNLHRSREQCFSGVLSVYQCYTSLMWPMHLRRKSASHTADHTLRRHISISPYPLIHMVSTGQIQFARLKMWASPPVLCFSVSYDL